MPTIYSQAFAAGTSDFCDPGHVAPQGTDPLYPEMWEAETIKVTVGNGPAGENTIETDIAGPASPYIVSGIWVSGQTWALPFFDITVVVKPDPLALNDLPNYAVIFGLLGNVFTPVFALYYDTTTQLLELTVDNGDQLFPLAISALDISDIWQTFRFIGANSTDNGGADADGYLKVYRNGLLIYDITDIYLVMGGGATPVATGYQVGYYGMLGPTTNITISDEDATPEPITITPVPLPHTITYYPASGAPYVYPLHGQRFVKYTQQLTAHGGDGGPYVFTLIAGALPPWVKLSKEGLLYGAPGIFGTYDFTVKATDSSGNMGTQAYTDLEFNPALSTTVV